MDGWCPISHPWEEALILALFRISDCNGWILSPMVWPSDSGLKVGARCVWKNCRIRIWLVRTIKAFWNVISWCGINVHIGRVIFAATFVRSIGLENLLPNINLMTHVKVLVLTLRTLRVTITDEIWMNTLTWLGTWEIILVCTGHTVRTRLWTGILAGMRIG